MVLSQSGDAAGAVDALEQAHYLQPDNAEILYHYGLALQLNGRGASARMRFEAVLRLNPNHAGAQEHLEALRNAGPDSAVPPPAAPSGPRATSAAEPAAHQARAEAPPRPPRDIGSAEPATFPGPPPRAALNAGAYESGAPMPRGGRARSRYLFEERGPADEGPGWERDSQPDISTLARAPLQLWGELLLLWLLLLAVPNGIAAALVPLRSAYRVEATWVWTLALGVGAAPVLLMMASQWVFEKPVAREWQPGFRRWLRGTLFALVYVLVVVGPVAGTLALRTPFPADVLILAALLLTTPFHALLAPALVLAATDGPAGWPALQSSFRLAMKRTWFHLALMVVLGLGLAAFFGVFGWALVVTLGGAGEVVARATLAVELTVAESVWAALVTVCGVDALSSPHTRELIGAPWPAAWGGEEEEPEPKTDSVVPVPVEGYEPRG